MAERVTERIPMDHLSRAASLLSAGKLVAFPTETVYGLGADAFNSAAVADIFVAKGRPSDNPLIVHIGAVEQLRTVASRIPEVAAPLLEHFWPGPLTIVVPKAPWITAAVTGGLETVAVRLPNHPVAIELLQRADTPIVAPSANRSGRPSATTWQSVAEDLDGRIDAIVMGGPTRIGLESTVLDLTQSVPCILRQGAVTQESICQVLGSSYAVTLATDSATLKRSPGTRHRHYQPLARVELIPAADTARYIEQQRHGMPSSARIAWIGWNAVDLPSGLCASERCASIEAYAARVYEFFRDMDHLDVSLIVCEPPPEEGLGRALNDRLRRASSR